MTLKIAQTYCSKSQKVSQANLILIKVIFMIVSLNLALALVQSKRYIEIL